MCPVRLRATDWTGRTLPAATVCWHNACKHTIMMLMGKAITIRNVPEETSKELAARAAATGRSLQEYLRSELIELARRPDPEVLLARVQERKRRTGSRLSADAILAYRDAGRR